MCGIVGMISDSNVQSELLQRLQRLEYRGYDSSGIAVVNGSVHVEHAVGKIENLQQQLLNTPLEGYLGIAHTRWATHGKPSLDNAHPHEYKGIAVVHNGIIENYSTLRSALEEKGHEFTSDTDTEVIPHLIYSHIEQGLSRLESISCAMDKFQGSFAICVVFDDDPNSMIVAKHSSPIVIGKTNTGHIVGSDVIAIHDAVEQVLYLEDGDIAEIFLNKITIYNQAGIRVGRMWHDIQNIDSDVSLQNFSHFTLKEIFEQPKVINDTLEFISQSIDTNVLRDKSRILMIACGSSYYAGYIAKYLFENIAEIPVDIYIASEFRYNPPPMSSDSVAVFISQSGETADTIAAMEYVKSKDIETVALTNVSYSSMARMADHVWSMKAGNEVGVAATKSFTSQVALLAHIASLHAHHNNHLFQLPQLINELLKHSDTIKNIAASIVNNNSVLFMGRGISYAVALESALKLKELSYIQAEAYAAGELKHGPIALVSEHMPVFVFAPYNDIFSKTLANAEELLARGADIYFITDTQGGKECNIPCKYKFILPDGNDIQSAILQTIFSQLLAYHTAVLKNLDVDKPRNLAKSVTVE